MLTVAESSETYRRLDRTPVFGSRLSLNSVIW